MFITADQLLAHLVGDYILQTHWMAAEKTKNSLVAATHVLTYTLPFLLLTNSWSALAVIAGTHFVIDRWRLARYVAWFKNQVAPKTYRFSLENSTTGYSPDVPFAISIWLLFITDNIMHIIINGLALYLL